MCDLIRLPFDGYEDQFLDLVRQNQVVILAAETGAGKSTKAPLALLRARLGGHKLIGVSEPRRPAATLLAKWVAELYGTALSGMVGYQIGQDNMVREWTKLAYVTEGVLLNQLHSDPHLTRYSIICLDEVHERGVNQDLLMALVKEVLPRRPDLKVVVMSATIDTDKFSKYFGDAPVLTVPGRIYPVEVRYAHETPDDYISAMVEKIDEILLCGEEGDILAFLPDADSINRVVGGLEKELGERARALRILPLFGAQAPDDQAEVFVRDERRRVIVATNIAETSLTIDGVRHVVDSGLIKSMVYVDASMSALQITEHSRAGCDQRKGRAGRTQDGICHRLFTRHDFDRRDGFTSPEILRMSLDQVLLQLRCLGFSMKEVLALPLMDCPDVKQWNDAEARLKLLGAIGEKGNVTKDGERMNRFHVEPMIGRMILEGERRDCLEEILVIAACLSATRPIFVRPKGNEDQATAAFQKFKNAESDALTMLAAWKAWDDSHGDRQFARDNFLSSKALTQIDRIRDNLWDMLTNEGMEITSAKSALELRKAIAAGLIVNLAQKAGRFSYRWNDRDTFIFPGSSVMGTTPQYVVCTKVVESTGQTGTKAYMRGVHAVDQKWLLELVSTSVCDVKVTLMKRAYKDKMDCFVQHSWNGISFSNQQLEEIPVSIMSHVIRAFVNWISEGYEARYCAPKFYKFWERMAPVVPHHVWGEARQKMLQPMIEHFVSVLHRKFDQTVRMEDSECKIDVDDVLRVIESVTAEEALIGEVLETYQKELIQCTEYERRVAAVNARSREESRRISEQREADARAKQEEAARIEREECVSVGSTKVRLPPELIGVRDLILMWLTELEEARKALQAELDWVETLKRGILKGEIIALTFRDRGDGFMVAEWKNEKILAPVNDLNQYPKNNESWWCHVIPGNGPTKIALCRKVGTKKADIEKILQDGLEMFPGLPTQLLQ